MKTVKNYWLIVNNIFTTDVTSTIILSVWRIISGPFTLILIPLFLNPVTQGFWYTFISLAALTVFADLGFTTIVSQFSAHEFAYLKFDTDGLLIGSEDHLNRLSSLFRFVIKWSALVSIIAFPLILAVGIIMFSAKDEVRGWLIPWILYILFSGLNFITGVCLSFFEGCNQIAPIQKNRLIASFFATITTWILLYLGCGLFTLPIAAIFGVMVNAFLLHKRFSKSIQQFLRISKNILHNWKRDFLSLIWRYAISWSSGYLIFQIYTPLSFQFHGAVFAGKVGLTMSLCSAIFSISNVWIYTSTPKLNMKASKSDWNGMDRLAKKSVLMSAGTFILGSISALILLQVLNGKIALIDRFLGIFPMTILLISWFCQIIISGLAIYLRAHKKEPLVLPSIVSAIYIAVSTYLISRYLPSDFLFMGFLTSYIFGLPWCFHIFITKRREWHLS